MIWRLANKSTKSIMNANILILILYFECPAIFEEFSVWNIVDINHFLKS